MSFDLLHTPGTPPSRQQYTWREMVQPAYSKLDDDVFTRIRVIWISAMDAEAVRFSHACARMNAKLQPELASLRRVEQHQQTLVAWLHPPDLAPLERALAQEQAEVEIIATVARTEPDPYLAQVHRFGLLEHVDHLYRLAALLDRLEGQDANTLLQSVSDMVPGRHMSQSHRAPVDDLRRPYDRARAPVQSKLHALVVAALTHQTRALLMAHGPLHADPLTRQLMAELASAEEQHATQADSLMDAREGWLEKWLMHEAAEVWAAWSCVETERNTRIRRVWERLLEEELGHFHAVRAIFEDLERRDAAEVIPARLPAALRLEGQRGYIRDVLAREHDLHAVGIDIVPAGQVPPDSASLEASRGMNADGSPSEAVAAGWRWRSGTELVESRPLGQGVAGRDASPGRGRTVRSRSAS